MHRCKPRQVRPSPAQAEAGQGSQVHNQAEAGAGSGATDAVPHPALPVLALTRVSLAAAQDTAPAEAALRSPSHGAHISVASASARATPKSIGTLDTRSWSIISPRVLFDFGSTPLPAPCRLGLREPRRGPYAAPVPTASARLFRHPSISQQRFTRCTPRSPVLCIRLRHLPLLSPCCYRHPRFHGRLLYRLALALPKPQLLSLGSLLRRLQLVRQMLPT